MKKIWITGANGHVGTALSELLDRTKYELFLTDKAECDITNTSEVAYFVRLNHPDVIINCAGMTNVEDCEQNIDEAYRVNALGIRNIAQSASSVQAKVIHISTDDVFYQGIARPFNEFDEIRPKTVYGQTKAAGEKLLTQITNRFVILRSSWVYGIGNDFVHEVLEAAKEGGVKLEVPNNLFACPTSATELAKVIAYFIDHEEYGIYHAVCPSGCSKYEFAKAILKYSGNEDRVDVYPVITASSTRPIYSILDNMMLRLSDIPQPADWRTALQDYFASQK